jgi:hypothetical protein
MMRVVRQIAALGGVSVASVTTNAQSPAAPEAVRITADWDVARHQPHDAMLRFTLSRPMTAADGRLAVIVGRTDLTALADMSGARVRLPLRGERLPAGDLDVLAYLVSPEGDWREVGRFPLKRLTRVGVESMQARPTLDLQTDGQLDARLPDGAPPAERGRMYQDVSVNAGVESAVHERGTIVALQGLLLGASREQARLRARQLGDRAPALDLASYNLRLTRPGVTLSAGHVGVGNQRHLVNQFRSRGVSAELQPMRAVQFGVAMVAGSELVGWSDPVGLSRPSHRVVVGSLGIEMIPARPGLFRADLTAIDGSRQATPSFNQQSITDREQSRGLGWQLSATDPTQRFRVAAGLARSRFDNPADAALSGDSTLVAVRRESRGARFGELSIAVVQNAKVARTTANLTVNGRRERIDPQYATVGVSLQADRSQDGIDATGNIDAVQFQYAATRGHDNLDRVASLLTTNSRGQSLTLSMPVSQLVRAKPDAWWWPSLTVGWQGAWQIGDAAPPNGGFRSAFQVPDQRTDNLTAGVNWQRSVWSVAGRYTRSSVDNRQPEREQSDFITTAQGVTFGYLPSPRLTLGLDVGADVQRSVETGTEARNRRVSAQTDWRPIRSTALSAAISSSFANDAASTRRGHNTEMRFEASQGVNVYRRPQDGSQMRVFVRYARAGAASRIADVLQPTVLSWTINGGVSVRFF